MGEMEGDQVIGAFQKIRWRNYLQQMQTSNEEEIHYSPSLEIECIENKNGLSISAIGDPYRIEYFIFDKRPKKVTKLFGLVKTFDDEYLTESTGQSEKDVLDCLLGLVDNDLRFLENKFK